MKLKIQGLENIGTLPYIKYGGSTTLQFFYKSAQDL